MYRTHEATIRHDKIYALLNMCSDDPETAGIIPDYGVAWETLLQRVTNFTLSENVVVTTLAETEMAVIKGQGRVLGKIFFDKRDASKSAGGRVGVSMRDTSGRWENTSIQIPPWIGRFGQTG